jgi:putative endonuclease
MTYFVYLLACKDGSIYTGITTDLARRLKEHNEGRGGRYTRAKKVQGILHTETYPDRSTASKREAAIKRLSRAAKLALATPASAVPPHSGALKKRKRVV